MSLFRRRTIWWPTAWGWAVLLVVVALLAFLGLRHAASLLAVDAPARGADGLGARLLVVEGWLDANALDQAVARARSGRYERVLTAGGPLDGWIETPRFATFAERSADYLQRHGLPVTAVPSPASQRERSFASAVAVRDWLAAAGRGGEAVDVFSAGVHARRSREIYRLAFGSDVEVGILAARPTGYEIDNWWTTSAGAKSVLDEAVSLAWTACCFWPPAAPSRPRAAPAESASAPR
jgi:hypothetical protein